MHGSAPAGPLGAILFTLAFLVRPVFIPIQLLPIAYVSRSLRNKLVNKPQPTHLVKCLQASNYGAKQASSRNTLTTI
jgi:hypothetical protein